MSVKKIRPLAYDKIPLPYGEWSPLPKPLPHPLDLEVGCGVGWHSVEYAKKNPGRHLIAIERTLNKYKSFKSRTKSHPHLNNLWPVHADALSWTAHFLPADSLDRLILHYPNPYPKARHAHLRWHLAPGFAALLRALKPGGELLYTTNLEWFATEAQEAFQEVWSLQQLKATVLSRDTAPRTHFEKKYMEAGQTCYEIRGQKLVTPLYG